MVYYFNGIRALNYFIMCFGFYQVHSFYRLNLLVETYASIVHFEQVDDKRL